MDQLRPTGQPLDGQELERLYAYPEPLARPWVKVNFVSSLDGAVAVDGHSRGLSDPNDLRILLLGRGLADVVLVAAGTVRTEQYNAITVAGATAERRKARGMSPVPRMAIVSRRCSIEPTWPVVTTGVVPPIVFTTSSAPQERREALTAAGVEVVLTGADDVDLGIALRELDARGLRRVCCEGGPHLFGTLIAADLVDELCLSMSPLLISGEAGRIATGPLPAEPVRMRLASALQADDLLMLRYLRR